MYKEFNDDEILYMVKEDDFGYELILQKYRPIIVNICKKYVKQAKTVGYEMDDLIQISNIAICQALSAYETSKNVLFYTFVIRCVENKIISELRQQSSNRKRVLNYSISYDTVIVNTNQTILESIADLNSIDPVNQLILNELEIKYINFINSLPIEVAAVFEMKTDGFTNDEISKFLNISKAEISRNFSYAKRRLCLN